MCLLIVIKYIHLHVQSSGTCIIIYMFICRRALEAKAAIYERLSRGDGLREEEEGEGEGGGEGEEGGSRYMVDFTKKIWEDVSWTC